MPWWANAQARPPISPFCTIEPTWAGGCPAPAGSLLSDVSSSKEDHANPGGVSLTSPGWFKGASPGGRAGQQIPRHHPRSHDDAWHVVRCFRDDDVIHVSGNVDQERDAEIINLGAGAADLAQVEKRASG